MHNAPGTAPNATDEGEKPDKGTAANLAPDDKSGPGSSKAKPAKAADVAADAAGCGGHTTPCAVPEPEKAGAQEPPANAPQPDKADPKEAPASTPQPGKAGND